MRRFSALLLPVWLALGAGWVLPFLVAQHTYPISTFYSEIGAAVCWIVIAIAILGVSWRRARGLPRVALAPLLLIVVLIAQLAIAPPLNPFFSFGAIVVLLAATAICGLGARCRDLPGTLIAIAIAVVVGGLITVVIELLQLFRVPNLPVALFSMTPSGTARRMWGNLNQPNHVGTYLAFGLAACLFLGNRYRKSRWLVLLAIAMLALLMGMALTFSRMTWIHVVVVGLLAGIPLSAESGHRSPYVKLLTFVGPALLLAVVYQGWNWVISFANHLWALDLPGSMGERIEAGVGLRPLLWKHAWHIFLTHPWLGGGWGDYAWNQYVQTDTLGRVEMSMNAHNIVLDQLAKVGVIGLFAVFAPIMWWALGLQKRLRHPDVAFAFALIAVMAVHSLLEYPLHYVFFLFPFAFALGYLDNRNMRIPSGSLAWLFSGLLVVCGSVLVTQLWVDYQVVERLYMSRVGAIKALEKYQESDQMLLVPYATLVMAMNVPITKEMAPVMVGLERQAVQFYPGPPVIQRYAIALAFQGKNEEAVIQIRRLRDHYWGDFSEQTALVRHACRRDATDLKTFCARLRSENLLVGVD